MWIANTNITSGENTLWKAQIATGEQKDKNQTVSGNEQKGAGEKDDVSRGVTIDISEQARERYRQIQEMYQQQADAAEEAGEACVDMAKLMEIARRIADGDIVPATDEKKLLEFSFELYQTAKCAAALNKDKERKEYDSLFEEEEDGVTREKMRELERASNGMDMEASASSEGISVTSTISEGSAEVG